MLKQSLYEENLAHSDDARKLGFEAIDKIKNLVAEYVVKGYSPREVEQVITNCLHQHVCRMIIDIRSNHVEAYIKSAFESKNDRENF